MNKSIFYFLILTLSVMSCQKPAHFTLPKTTELFGLASPIILQPGETTIYLGDYFPDALVIDTVMGNPNLQLTLSADKKELRVKVLNESLPALSELKVKTKQSEYSLLIKRTLKAEVTFSYDPKGTLCKEIFVAGDINGWNRKANPLEFKNGKWETHMILNPGKYAYRLVVDGKEMLDPANPDSLSNNLGGYNSVIYVGQITQEPPFITSLNHDDQSLTLGSDKALSECFVYWQNFRIPASSVKIKNNTITFLLPVQAQEIERSFIRVWSYNESGVSNDLLIPLEKGKIIENPGLLKRTDKQTMIMYFLMVDRFVNGNPKNDHPLKMKTVLPKADYYGGDLAGVTQKITDGYFKNLGINVIWISPITQNPLGAWGLFPNPKTQFSAYHGYWPITLTTVDFRFGTAQDMHTLVKTAHDGNMNVLLDYVAHHVHKDNLMFKQHPDWQTPLYLPDGTLNTEKWDEYRLTTWFDVFLPTLDLSRPEVYEPLSDSAMFWVKNFDLDGFRHDATKHVPEIFWRTLTSKIKTRLPEDKSVYQIGETYGNRELIGSYVGSGQMDAQFDFNVYDDAVSALAKTGVPFSLLKNSLSESLTFFGDHNLMGYITGNQDRPRFISLAGGSLRFDENSKVAGWTRDITVGDTISYSRLAMLMAFNMSIPGIPVIYYGDELGMPGANDPDNRRMMYFKNLNPHEKKMLETTTHLTELRRNSMAALYGDTRIENPNDDILIIYRHYLGKVWITVINKSEKAQSVTIHLPSFIKVSEFDTHFGSIMDTPDQVSIAGNSFEVLTSK